MTILTVFRSRLRPGVDSQYETLAAEISAIAKTMPGFLEEKSFTARDGERVTIVLFGNAESHLAWRDHPRHREAQVIGKTSLYMEYRVYSAEVDYTASLITDAVS